GIPEVLLVGAFHFAYYNLDAHKVKEEDQIDILHPSIQKEIKELVDYIAAFQPTMICVESGPNTGYLMRNYEEWLAGTRDLQKSETEQLAFRLMHQFGLDTIYGVNDGTLVYDLLEHKDSLCFLPIIDSLFAEWDFRSNDPSSVRYNNWYNYEDSISRYYTMLEMFQFMNTHKYRERTYGSYLVGDFKNGSNSEGADALALHWYSRNLRIYRNILDLHPKPNDRIMVLFGAGHMGILDHLFRASPEFRLIEFSELENRP
ncbi:MAG: hypothetical protein RL226_1780, partial [Bacteroidota bacterium]